jgi:hypothetical protein
MSTDHPSDFAARLELAWAAGFFDGEGSTYLTRTSHRADWTHVNLGVAQVERGPLERFQRAVGGRIVGPYMNGNYKGRERAKPIWKWTCAGFPAKAVLRLLWPYLSEPKKAQAQRALDVEVNSGKPLAQNRTHCPNGHEYAAHEYVRGDGHRRCRLCDRERQRKATRRHRAKMKALNTHCPHGHEYAVHGYVNGRGSRRCRPCDREMYQTRDERRRTKAKALKGD